jgi:hypothetical protein
MQTWHFPGPVCDSGGQGPRRDGRRSAIAAAQSHTWEKKSPRTVLWYKVSVAELDKEHSELEPS